jgi:prophage regulatory protein
LFDLAGLLFSRHRAKTRLSIFSEDKTMQFLRIRKVTDMVGFSKTTLYAHVRDGSFPKPITLGPKSVAFLESDVLDWMQRKIAQENSNSETRRALAQRAARSRKKEGPAS